MKIREFAFVLLTAGLVSATVADEPVAPTVAAPVFESNAQSVLDSDGAAPPVPMGMIYDGAVAGPPRFWTSAEYLLWWMKPVCQKASLLNSGSPSDPIPGANGQPNTVGILTDTARYNMPGASGLRLSMGGWFVEHPRLGWDASIFWLGRTENNALNFASGSGSPYTYIPYTDQNNNAQAIPFTVPGQVGGSIVAVGSSQLWGDDANLIYRAVEDYSAPRSASLLFGFRNLNLHDEVNIVQTQTLLSNPSQVAIGGANFQTHNTFYAPQVGARFETQFGRLFLSATGKFAAGEVHLVSDVAGNPLISGTQVLAGSVPGPLIAFPSNVGQASAWSLGILEEISLRARYALGRHLDLTLGYNLIYLNRISCPGDNMPQIVNVTQVPALGPQTGKVLPTPTLARTDYFAHGLNVGLQYAF